jgi:lipoprotein-releasing system permease protein
MNLAALLSRRILRQTTGRSSAARPVIRIAIAGIALGVAAMLLSVMVVTGFRNEISSKATGFAGHLRVHPFNSNNSFEDQPMHPQVEFLASLKNEKSIRHVQQYAYKAGIIKTGEDIQGIVLKGAAGDFDWSFFKSKLTDGRIPEYRQDSLSYEVLISSITATRLKLKTGDDFLIFFIQEDRKVRKLKIAGIYNTGLGEEFDAIYMICDLKLIQRINNWKQQEIGGYEIWLNDIRELERMTPVVYKKAGLQLTTQTIRELYPQLFNWLELQNLNVIVIITLISLVAGITMISTLLILVLEDTRTIGILKTLGAGDKLVSGVYLRVAIYLLLNGLLWGNVAGIGIALLQHTTGIFSLPEDSYYLSKIPVAFTWTSILIINAGTLIVCTLMLLAPSRVISKINPVKVLRFD